MASIKVVLQGGPAYLPGEMRQHEVAGLDDHVKVPWNNGYEHFQYSGEVTDDAVPRFVWTYRTVIAE